MRLLIASNSQHKIREIRQILAPYYPDIQGLREAGLDIEVVEDGNSFAENAWKKASQVSQATGFAALADDSGLCVDALDGAPGIYSARFSGVHGADQANNRLLLARLAGKPRPWTAHYACAIALCRPGLPPIQVEAYCQGEILPEYRGNGGFGYDPLFLPAGCTETFAQMDAAQKNRISHRAKALALLLQALESEARA